jgi:hypothetical protein
LKSPVNEPPLQLLQWGPYAERCPSPEPSFIYLLGSPVKKPSLQVPLAEPPLTETLRFQSPHLLSLEVPSKQTPPPAAKGANKETASCFQCPFFIHCSEPPQKNSPLTEQNLTFLSKCPVKEHPLPSCSPNRAPMERETPPPEPMLYSFIHISQSPQLRSSPT